MKTEIVDHLQVEKIIKRLAYQIYERNFDVKELIIASIEGQGKEVALLISDELKKISKINVKNISIRINKVNPETESILLSDPDIKLNDKTIVLVDDVLNTGRTLLFGIMPFLNQKLKSIQVAVLVERSHNSFPISADFVGISLQTTLQEHVSVIMKNHKINIYLE